MNLEASFTFPELHGGKYNLMRGSLQNGFNFRYGLPNAQIGSSSMGLI
jgi:hypothetical protein